MPPPPGLLGDAYALTLILKQLRVENHLTTSLRELHDFSAVNQYARDHLVVHYAEIVHALLSVDMSMSPSDLVLMILDMSLSQRAKLVRLVSLSPLARSPIAKINPNAFVVRCSRPPDLVTCPQLSKSCPESWGQSKLPTGEVSRSFGFHSTLLRTFLFTPRGPISGG